MAKQRVLVGWPDGGSVHGAFTKALLDLQRFELTQPSDDYEVIDCDRTSSIYITENRNNLVKLARAMKADWLLQLDGDETFEPYLLRQLFRTANGATRPVVVGLYSNIANFHEVGKGSFDVVDCIYGEVKNGAYRNVRPPENMLPFKVDAAGTGIMLCHMSVFSVVGYPWFWNELIHVHGANEPQFMNEDIAFCRSLREAGIEIWCDPLAEAIHWKNIPLSPSTLRDFMNKVRKAHLEVVGQTDLDAQSAKAPDTFDAVVTAPGE